jgi:nitrogen-specific signal transduction histidine kinase
MTPQLDGSAPDLAMVAHDICNCLTPILGAVAILELIPNADPQVTQAADIIARQADALRKLAACIRPRTATRSNGK